LQKEVARKWHGASSTHPDAVRDEFTGSACETYRAGQMVGREFDGGTVDGHGPKKQNPRRSRADSLRFALACVDADRTRFADTI